MRRTPLTTAPRLGAPTRRNAGSSDYICVTEPRGDAENAGLENAGLENAGTSCVWVAKYNIISVRGHVRVNVTAGRGDPCTLQEAILSGN